MKSTQEIHFAKSGDGARIAYATSGEGEPLVKAANWLSHIEYDWDSPVWRHWLHDLSAHVRLIRYDERGCGLSDRDVADLSFRAWVDDLEAVVDAAGIERFPLLGVSQGGAVAIAYAVRHPERVSKLILYGAYARGRLVRDQSALALEEAATMRKLIELGWGRESEAFRQVFTAQFIPGGSLDQLHAFNELQRLSCSPANAARFLDEFNHIDELQTAAHVRCPTLVLHARGDERVPFDEGRLLAAQIPGAQFVPLESANHVLLADQAWDAFMATVLAFLGVEKPVANHAAPLALLTARERDVLELIACGLDNSTIAQQLGVQVKTVRNHITHIFDKLDVHNRGQAIVKAREAGMGGETAGKILRFRARSPHS